MAHDSWVPRPSQEVSSDSNTSSCGNYVDANRVAKPPHLIRERFLNLSQLSNYVIRGSTRLSPNTTMQQNGQGRQETAPADLPPSAVVMGGAAPGSVGRRLTPTLLKMPSDTERCCWWAHVSIKAEAMPPRHHT
jgi:hypothetical protein